MENVVIGIKETPAILQNYMRIMSIKWINKSGKTRRWEAVRRVMKDKEINKTGFDDIVVVVPITDDGEIVFISQFRATVGAVLAGDEETIDESRYQIIEFPAGVVDEKRTKAETAVMELQQEAGLSARKIQIINEGPISAGLSFEYVTEYLATDLYPLPRTGGDEQSEIKVHEIPLKEALDWIREKRKEGFVIDSRVIPLIGLVNEILRGEIDGKK